MYSLSDLFRLLYCITTGKYSFYYDLNSDGVISAADFSAMVEVMMIFPWFGG